MEMKQLAALMLRAATKAARNKHNKGWRAKRIKNILPGYKPPMRMGRNVYFTMVSPPWGGALRVQVDLSKKTVTVAALGFTTVEFNYTSWFPWILYKTKVLENTTVQDVRLRHHTE